MTEPTSTPPTAPPTSPTPPARQPVHRPALFLSGVFLLAAPAPLLADTLPIEVAIAAKLVTLGYAAFLAYLAFAPRRTEGRA